MVTVRVTLDQEGNVTSSEVEAGRPPLTGYAMTAAQKWTFIPDYKRETREVLLSFVFAGIRETEERSHVEGSLIEPLTMRLVYVESTVRRLPRDGGEIAEKRCPVHQEVMKVDLVPIHYGYPGIYVGDESSRESRRLSEREAFWEAQQKLFPESNWSVGGGCVVHSEKKTEVYYCRACREAELAWLRHHPDFDRQE